MRDLETLRKKIDKVDNAILDLLKQRFELIEEVATYKKVNNMPALQSKRWEEVLNSKKEKARKLGLDEEMIENIWNEIHNSALKKERKVLG